MTFPHRRAKEFLVGGTILRKNQKGKENKRCGVGGLAITRDFRQGLVVTIRPCSVESHTCTSAPKGVFAGKKMKEAMFFKDDTREKTEGVRNEETSEGR